MRVRQERGRYEVRGRGISGARGWNKREKGRKREEEKRGKKKGGD